MLARNLQLISGVEKDRQWTTSRAMEKPERRAFPLFWSLDVGMLAARDERGRTGEGGVCGGWSHCIISRPFRRLVCMASGLLVGTSGRGWFYFLTTRVVELGKRVEVRERCSCTTHGRPGLDM